MPRYRRRLTCVVRRRLHTARSSCPSAPTDTAPTRSSGRIASRPSRRPHSREAGVDTDKYQAHAIRGETLSKLRALGWPSEELLPLSRHSTIKALERSYIRRAPERVLALKINRARYLPEEALRL